MQVNGVKSNLAFGGTMKNVSSAIDTAAETTSNLADLMSTASLAMDTPEVATVKVLNEKLADVSNNEKVPSFVRKGIKYTCGLIATGLTFAITRNVVRGQGKFVDLAKKCLNKFDIGKSIVKFGASVKESLAKVKLSEKLHLDGKFDFIKRNANKVVQSASDLLDKTPKIKAGFGKIGDLIKIKEWTRKDYIANIAATILAAKHAKKVINTPDKAVKPTEIVEQPVAKEVEDKDFSEAA